MHGYIVISHTLSMLYLYRDVSSQFMPGAFPMAPQMAPMRMPMPVPPMAPMMQMPMQAPAVPFPVVQQQKLPVVVMPYYSKSANQKSKRKSKSKKKKRKYQSYSSSSETSSSCESGESGESSKDFEFRANKRAKLKNTRRQVLTPVVSYVTKDGYVIYQKKIRKDKARDWLQLGEKDRVTKSNEIFDSDDEGTSSHSRSQVSRRSRSNRHQH